MSTNKGLNELFSYSFSLDCLIFGYSEGKINVLLIKRDMDPYKDQWAIPGDLIKPEEDLPNAAKRILFDLTSLKNIELHQSQTFGKPDRHPQGRVITCAYFALVKLDEIDAKASSWANEIKWVPVNEIEELAFDHNEILNSTFEILKQKLNTLPICFDLLPPKFTLNEMQQLYEFAFDVEMDKANFRKKIKNLPLIDLKQKQKNVKHRPARLFKFDEAKYQDMVDNDDYTFKMLQS
ncbi:MAG: NUDIX hydrolase [Flavobacteriales bacterium]|nr:NUDIX hydrolase [Flavobacteriales bacterium]